MLTLFECRLGFVADFLGQIAVMWPELVSDLGLLTQSIQKMRVSLNLSTAVRENEIVGAAQGSEHVLGNGQRCSLRFRIVLAPRPVRGCGLFKPFD